MTAYRLFGELAHRYDLHTPAGHYTHDHAFVLDAVRDSGLGSSILDVGCGTGVFIEKAVAAGFDAFGVDASPEMVAIAQARVGSERARVTRMETLEVDRQFDVVCALSWTLNYVRADADLGPVVQRLATATRPGGRVIVQVAHAPHATGDVFVDREAGPSEEPDDVTFIYRFTAADRTTLIADYVYACSSARELAMESHTLRGADALLVADAFTVAELEDVVIVENYRSDPFCSAVAPFVLGRRPR